MFDTFSLTRAPDGSPRPAESTAEHINLLALHQQEENAAAARKCHAATDSWHMRMADEMALGAEGSAITGTHSIYAEIALVTGTSHRAAQTLVEVGTALDTRLPLLDYTFRAGDIGYAKVRTICQTLTDASLATLGKIEGDVVAAARHLTPQPLRKEIWRLWIAANPKEAGAVQDAKKVADRTVYIRAGEPGLASLSACITDIEGAQAQLLIDEIANSVCSADPRSLPNRRADALMALLHGDRILKCQCDAEACPTQDVDVPARRTHLTQILIDIETLLGLTNKPARLSDGTPLHPDLARALAEDSTWQAILTEMRSLAETQGRIPDDTTNDPAAGNAPAPDRFTCTHYLGSGRKRRPASPAVRAPICLAPTPIHSNGRVIDEILDAIACDAYLHPRNHDTGQSRNPTPPPSALTYRPRADVAALVRAAYPTCVFPNCSVPSKNCELDHRIPFDHNNPRNGGWTIFENLQPLCKKHHDIKTRRHWKCRRLPNGAIEWTSPTRLRTVTLPAAGRVAELPAATTTDAHHGPPTPTAPPSYADPVTADDREEYLCQTTWWERHMGGAEPPTPVGLATSKSAQQQNDTEYLHQRYRDHLAIAAERERTRPLPF
ncbi:HNH endonuclease signature motif containing protein [Antrihabitans spumae]|uniref:DUF222 domain-containing protein n=1 Tax=Antrihabitans spumae TaxID=3373370 RepID=A0ABW7JXB0_9NOCA